MISSFRPATAGQATLAPPTAWPPPGTPQGRGQAAAPLFVGLQRIWVWVKIQPTGHASRRFYSLFPFTRVPFWVPIFDPRRFLPASNAWTGATCAGSVNTDAAGCGSCVGEATPGAESDQAWAVAEVCASSKQTKRTCRICIKVSATS